MITSVTTIYSWIRLIKGFWLHMIAHMIATCCYDWADHATFLSKSPTILAAKKNTCHALNSASPKGGHWAPRTWFGFGPAFEAPKPKHYWKYRCWYLKKYAWWFWSREDRLNSDHHPWWKNMFKMLQTINKKLKCLTHRLHVCRIW